jgi:hypothetical protein
LGGVGWVLMYRRLKYLGLVMIMLLALYPIAELTRVIVISGTFYFPEMKWQLVSEVTIMWFLYLSIVPVFLLFNNRKIRHLRKLRRGMMKRPSDETDIAQASNPGSEHIPVKFVR